MPKRQKKIKIIKKRRIHNLNIKYEQQNSNKLPWANKDLGQHFLKDQEVIDLICNDFKDDAESILEVGPGPGILSKHLAEHELPYHVIEKDKRFPEILSQWISADQITLGDALKVDLSELFENKNWNHNNTWLVSNLPYNVGVPLLINFMQEPSIKFMTLMFQKEVGGKIVPSGAKKKNTMGSLMALCQNYFDCEIVCMVPPEAFQPPPKVDSIVVSLKRKSSPEIDLSEFLEYESFLRKLFAMKRKQVGTVLKGFYLADKLEGAFAKCEIDRRLRAETFSLEQVRSLYRALKK